MKKGTKATGTAIETDHGTATSADNIIIKGARVNNLKNIDLTIPRGKLIVITGLSGSGKSSLAFDTCLLYTSDAADER